MRPASTTYKGVAITVYLKGTTAIASLVRGDQVEHHTIEHNPTRALILTTEEAMTRAKGLLT